MLSVDSAPDVDQLRLEGGNIGNTRCPDPPKLGTGYTLSFDNFKRITQLLFICEAFSYNRFQKFHGTLFACFVSVHFQMSTLTWTCPDCQAVNTTSRCGCGVIRWECAACTYHNHPYASYCAMCQTDKGAGSRAPAGTVLIVNM
jgi:hypothetical protein